MRTSCDGSSLALISTGRTIASRILCFLLIIAALIAADSKDDPDLRAGVALLEAHQHRQALERLKQAVHHLPQSADAHNYYGFALAREGMLAESIVEFQRALQLDARHAEAQYNLGCAFLVRGDATAAVKPLETAVALRDPFPEAHSALAMAVFSSGNLERAVGELRIALRQRPGMTSAHNQLGMILSQMGEEQQALSELRFTSPEICREPSTSLRRQFVSPRTRWKHFAT